MDYQLSQIDRVVLSQNRFAIQIIRDNRIILASHVVQAHVTSWESTTEDDEQRHTIHFDDQSQLRIALSPGRVTLDWEASKAEFVFDISAWWYGQGELINQQWPMNNLMLQRSPLITVDNGETGLSCIQAPLWLSSDGLALLVKSPVEVAFNAPPEHYKRYTWGVGFGNVPGPFYERPYPANNAADGSGRFGIYGQDLSLEILIEPEIKAAHDAVIRQVGYLKQVPPANLISKPIWNTWARYHADINQEVVLQYAQEIVAYDYPRSRFVIDDKWQRHYGDLRFDPNKFPDPRGMIDKLHDLGFEVNTWIIPFITEGAEAFAVALENKYVVQTQEGAPYKIRWWQGDGYLLDVTNPVALDWFLVSLRELQRDTGLDGFKFDAGEAVFLPEDAVTFESIERNEYTRRYIEFVGQHFPWSDVRSGWRNESTPVLFRQWDKASTWRLDNGLHSVITGALSLSLSGYPLFLPDMIGGNAYSQQPSEELMIRWAQVNALMPGMQFSLAPWDFGEQATQLCRRYTVLHQEFASFIIELLGDTIHSGDPVVRPMFWAEPSPPLRTDVFAIDDQFMLGDRFVVAPIVAQGLRQRDIFLPSGRWKDYWADTIHDGPITVENYPVPLDKLPIFEAVGDTNLYEA